jgi:hypothetical protein
MVVPFKGVQFVQGIPKAIAGTSIADAIGNRYPPSFSDESPCMVDNFG